MCKYFSGTALYFDLAPFEVIVIDILLIVYSIFVSGASFPKMSMAIKRKVYCNFSKWHLHQSLTIVTFARKLSFSMHMTIHGKDNNFEFSNEFETTQVSNEIRASDMQNNMDRQLSLCKFLFWYHYGQLNSLPSIWRFPASLPIIQMITLWILINVKMENTSLSEHYKQTFKSVQ